MAVPVTAPGLGIDTCRNDDERRYLERLDARVTQGGWRPDAWPHAAGHVIVSVCPVDAEQRSLLRTLRADYVHPQLLFGPDETHQFATDLDPSRPGVTLLPNGRPEDLADAAADWFESELSRQIVREEWIVPGGSRERCVLVDNGQVLTLRGTWNAAVRQALGPPDKRTIVWPRRAGGTPAAT